LYKNQKHAEFEWSVGPIPFEDGLGRDIALRFSTGLNSRSVFYTDANGRHMMRRERDYRPTWDLNVTEPIAGNYYPVTAAAVLRDEQDDAEFTVLTDRAQGRLKCEGFGSSKDACVPYMCI
jgi:lysosomal alpha-mannosidase